MGRLQDIEYKEIPKLNEKKWKQFFISDILQIDGGTALKKSDMIPGNTPFVSASAMNNAVTNFVGNDNKSKDKNMITINTNGSVGEVFYHPYSCLVCSDVARLHLKGFSDNEFVDLFIVTTIKKQKEKFSYGYKFGHKRINRQIIVVPINDNDQPDYGYMEQYIKNMIWRKLNTYIDWVS